MNPIPEDAEVTTASRQGGGFSASRGRNVLVAVDHGRDSRGAFAWALTHLVQPSDTLHLLYVRKFQLLHSLHKMLFAVSVGSADR